MYERKKECNYLFVTFKLFDAQRPYYSQMDIANGSIQKSHLLYSYFGKYFHSISRILFSLSLLKKIIFTLS